MSPVDLEGALPSIVGRRELLDGGRSAKTQKRAEETAVKAVILEIFVHAGEVLSAIAEIGPVKSARIDHRRGAGQTVCVRCSTTAWENVVGGFGSSCAGNMGGHVGSQKLGTKRIWIVGLCPGGKSGIGKCQHLIPRRDGRTKGFDSEKEEKLMMGDDWAADCRGNIVAVKWSVSLGSVRQRVLGIHALAREIVAGQAMKFVRT